jgi:hypothetical protein
MRLKLQIEAMPSEDERLSFISKSCSSALPLHSINDLDNVKEVDSFLNDTR